MHLVKAVSPFDNVHLTKRVYNTELAMTENETVASRYRFGLQFVCKLFMVDTY